MQSPLSFNHTENFRKKLLVRNLKPYKVNQIFSTTDTPAQYEYNIVDYSVIDSPSLEEIGNKQEGVLLVQNKYGPPETNLDFYGSTVQINLNLNKETNQGKYGYPKTVKSKLEIVGNTQETFLYVKNLYGPQNKKEYGDTVIINKLYQPSTNLGEYDYSDSLGSKLELKGNEKEITLYALNKYGPQNSTSYGDSVIFNFLTLTPSNSGEYDSSDAVNSDLETIGQSREILLYKKNKYGPENLESYGDTVIFADGTLSISNVGEYGPLDTVASLLETKGQLQEIELYKRNKYGPENLDSYGDTVIFKDTTLSISNVGEYGPLDTIASPLETEGQLQEVELYKLNKYGPADDIDFGETVDINTLNINGSNFGPYNETAGSGPNRSEQESRILAYVSNEYGPENIPGGAYGNEINEVIDANLQTSKNVGEYRPSLSPIPLTTPQSQAEAYGDNKYVSGLGKYQEVTIEDLTQLIPRTFLPYANSETTFIFIPSTYTPYSILIQDNPSGSEGSLSQDSNLAKIGATRLKREFKFRVEYELVQQTLGRINALETTIDDNTGGISVKPNTDPFNALGIVTGNIPLFERNYAITAPNLLVGKGINFVAKLAGLYSPYSYIPGEYFDYPRRRFLNELIENPVNALLGPVFDLVNDITSLNIETGSERFLANTSIATTSLLFEQLYYNFYRPDYRLNSFTDPNIGAPKPNYYIGTRKNFLKEIKPIDQQPKNRDGIATETAIFGHGGMAVDYEGPELDDLFYFGLTSRNYYDGANNAVTGNDIGTVYGGFTWAALDPVNKIGGLVGYNNEQIADSSLIDTFKDGVQQSLSTRGEFKEGSILDVTQRLVQKGNDAGGQYVLRHVGTAINQLSKVFNDGNIELTKGSRVIRYSTPTSVGATSQTDIKGYEYCRVWTKDNPYYSFTNLQKTDGITTAGRRSINSVLDNTYNLNIAPMKGDSTNIDFVGNKVKKYMLSLENLAWRTSNRPGFTVEDLPVCEIGPNGGRIMWFPPYDVSFGEASRTQWNEQTFLGRPEPIYTYQHTSRTGDLSFKIVVDHPSILNVIVNKELAKATESKLTKVVDSFFAGCLKYDPYDLLRKFSQFTLQDIFEVITTTTNKDIFEDVIKENPPTTTSTIVTNTPVPAPPVTATTASTVSFEQLNPILFFENDYPKKKSSTEPTKSLSDYASLYSTYTSASNKTRYSEKCYNKIVKYNDKSKTARTGVSPTNSGFYGEYVDATQNGIKQFFEFIETEKSKFDDVLKKTLQSLKNGNTVTLKFQGGASAKLQDSNYNVQLSSRRIDSVKNYMNAYKISDAAEDKMSTYFIRGTLKVLEETGGGYNTKIEEGNYSGIDCSKPFVRKTGEEKDSSDSIYSVNAMACRKVKLVAVDQAPQQPPPQQTVTPAPEQEEPSVLPDVNAGTDNAPVYERKKVGTQTTTTTTTSQRQDLTKRMMRKLLSECDYFEMIKEEEPMIYDGIKQKIKHFNPAFHSMTPEGLNSRLTFLQQCMRPGDTIPTVTKTDNGTTLLYKDAFNSAFGSPPVCVLRVGDFFHTKIVINDLSITYPEDGQFDLNPEGIGVQPMIAEIKLGFSFIGGQGIAGPVRQLQNALSFNYYANTEIYDERAEETETGFNAFSKEYIDDVLRNLGVGDPTVTRPEINNGGVTLGVVLSQDFNATTNSIFGQIQYKDIMIPFVTGVQDYYKSVYQTLSAVHDKHLLGGLLLASTERKYINGTMNGSNVKIFGYPIKIQNRVNLLFSKTEEDVENDLCPLLGGITLQNFKNSDIRKVKKQLKKMISDKKGTYLSSIEQTSTTSTDNQIKIITEIDKINFITAQRDGKLNSTNISEIYNLSGTSQVASSSYANTMLEIQGDYNVLATDIDAYYNDLISYEIIPGQVTGEWNNDFTFNLNVADPQSLSIAPENRFYMVFGFEILENPIEMINQIVSVVDSDETNKWTTFISDNIGYTTNGEKLETGLYPKYETAKNYSYEFFKTYETESVFYKKYKTTYIPYSNVDKERVMDFVKQNPTNQNDADYLQNIWGSYNSTDDSFNFKKKFIE